MRCTLLSLVLFSLAGCPVLSHARLPNILLILTDDQGTVDLNAFGAHDLHTPNLDALASNGIKFTQFYVAAPVCSPSRGAIQTGRYPANNGITGNGQSLKAGETTIAEMLKPLGYRTATIGKWHMGMDNGGPNGEGYDTFFGHRDGCIENYGHDTLYWDTGAFRKHDLWRNNDPIHEDENHFGELLVREANSFMEQNRNHPFFMYVAFNSPHYPVQPLPHHLKRYAGIKEPRRSYAAFVSTMDEQVGKILDKLHLLGLEQDTFVIFLSDHGHSIESRNNLFLPDADPDNPGGGSAGPFRGNKFTLWEGGIRVPCILSWPGRIGRDQTRDTVATSMDFLPTIAHYTGAALPDTQLDGKSLARVIDSPDAPSMHDVLHWVWKDHWAVRRGDWKLVCTPDERILSKMSSDVSESSGELAAAHPDIVRELTALHEAWLKRK